MNKPPSDTGASLDWNTLCALLPPGWERQASEKKAFLRVRKFSSPEELLRVLLIHVVQDIPLAETAVWANLDGIPITHMAIQRRLAHCVEWIEWITEALAARLSLTVHATTTELPAGLAELPLIVVDATTVRQPGSTGTDQRVHLALDVQHDRTVSLQGTDAHTGETFRNFPIVPGALYIGDRAYGNRPGILHVVAGGGYPLVRINGRNLPLTTPEGTRFDLLGMFRTLPEHDPGEWPAGIPDTHPPVMGRVCAKRLDPAARARAEQRVREQARKRGRPVNPDTLEMAGFICVFTTLPESVADAQTVLDVYLARWQVEIRFKRDKHILRLGANPKKNPRIARAWLALKLLSVLLVEALRQKTEAAFFPSLHSRIPPGARTQSVARMEPVREGREKTHHPLDQSRQPARSV